MYARLGGIIGSVSGPFHPFGGAVDIVVVQQQDGTFKSSPWYVRFGKFQGVLKSRENSVNICVNGNEADFHMYLDGKGEAFFLRCADLDADDFATSSPVSSSSCGDETEEKTERNESLNVGKEGSENGGLIEGQIVKRTDGRRSILGFMFGRKSSKNRGDSNVDRRTSMERAEIASDLMEMKWSTNLSMKDRSEFQSNYKTLEGQDGNSLDNGASKILVDNGESLSENVVDNGDSVNIESTSTNLRGRDENELQRVVKVQATEINTTEIELNEKSYTITETKITSQKVCVTGLELNSTNLRGQNEIVSSLNDCLNGDSVLHVKTEEKVMSFEVRETSQVINFGYSEINKEKVMDNSEKNKVDYIEGGELNTNINPKLVTVNSDSSDMHFPDSIDTSSDVSVDKTKELEVSSGEGFSVSKNLQSSLDENLEKEKCKIRENVSSLTNELESNQMKDDDKSGNLEYGISNSGNSEDLQFSFSDGEGKTEAETDTNERETIESDNEEINSKSKNGTQNGSTRFESSPVCIPSIGGTRNMSMAVSLPNLYYDASENVERLSSSLGLESELKREIHAASLSTELVKNCENICETGRPDQENQEQENQERENQETRDLTKGMDPIRVDEVQGENEPTGSWWSFGFRRSRSVSVVEGNLEEMQGVECKSGKMVRSLTPSSDELASLGLKEGCNDVMFRFNTSMLGNQQVDARIFLWKWNTRVVISDVDGTITKSDVLGQFMPLVGVDWSHTGVAHLFSAIKENGYQLLFLSARAISQAHITRRFLINLKQDGKTLPGGPVVISPDGLFPSLYREVIRRAPHEFKIACLEDIKALFPADCNPFYAGFGNRDTDELSYLKVGIPMGKIFIINPKGQVAVNRRVDTKSYSSLHELVHGMFPPYSSSPEQEGYNDINFWRLPMPEME